ncbi:DUF4333 domain-containing protein [Cyanobacteria bacterium FACHB-63]|nr:DUF4333 domain-containing protein [Cyanobacteria bacterium FACHB-63]
MTNKLGYFMRSVSPENIKVWVGGLLASLLFLGGCSRTLDAKRIEENILSGITKQGASSLKTVICPTNVSPAAGKEFECIGVLDSGSGVPIAVTQQDDQGTVTWDVPSVRGLLNMTVLQSEFEQALKQEVKAKVDCGLSVYRLVKPGETFECQLVKRESKSERDSAETDLPEKQDLSKTVQVTPAAIDKPKTTVPTQADDSKPTEIIQVTIQPSGDVNWQRVIKVPATNVAIATPTERTTASTSDPQANQSDTPKPSAPVAKSAEDFLNQPGATDDFE